MIDITEGGYISKGAAANAVKNECGVGKYKVVEKPGYKYSYWRYECLSENKCMDGYSYINGKCVVSYPTSSCAGNCDSRTQVCVSAGDGRYYCADKKTAIDLICTHSDRDSCKDAANHQCNYGFTGCTSAGAYGCYTYTCKTKPVCDYSDSQTCKYSAQQACGGLGFTGCTSAGAYGCYTYTCKVNNSGPCTCRTGTNPLFSSTYSGTCVSGTCHCDNGGFVLTNNCK